MEPSGFIPLSPKTPLEGPGRPQRREGVTLALPGDRSSSGDDARMAEGKKMCCRVCRLPHLFSAVLSTGAKRPISSRVQASARAQAPGEVCGDLSQEGQAALPGEVQRVHAGPAQKARSP